jgi:hypothetical protein
MVFHMSHNIGTNLKQFEANETLEPDPSLDFAFPDLVLQNMSSPLSFIFGSDHCPKRTVSLLQMD